MSMTALLALVVALTIGASTASAIVGNQQTYNLYAGQTTLVGDGDRYPDRRGSPHGAVVP